MLGHNHGKPTRAAPPPRIHTPCRHTSTSAVVAAQMCSPPPPPLARGRPTPGLLITPHSAAASSRCWPPCGPLPHMASTPRLPPFRSVATAHAAVGAARRSGAWAPEVATRAIAAASARQLDCEHRQPRRTARVPSGSASHTPPATAPCRSESGGARSTLQRPGSAAPPAAAVVTMAGTAASQGRDKRCGPAERNHVVPLLEGLPASVALLWQRRGEEGAVEGVLAAAVGDPPESPPREMTRGQLVFFTTWALFYMCLYEQIANIF